MPTSVFNATSSPTPAPTGNNALQPDVSTLNNSPTDNERDSAYAAEARQRKGTGDNAGANESISNIKDPQKKQATQDELFGSNDRNTQQPPTSLVQDGSGGLSDPLALFFMMVFYLKEATPTFNWDDVLKTASGYSNQKFGTVVPTDGRLPQRQFADSGPKAAVSSPVSQQEAQAAGRAALAQRETEKKEADKRSEELQKSRDASPRSYAVVAKEQQSGGKKGSSGPVVVWPIQCMPVIAGGLNKTVDWPNQQVPTLAEPTIALNRGASPIEIDVEFTYAVGVYGIGDGEITAMTGETDPETGQPATSSGLPQPPDQQGKWWTVEEIMGMMYLATTLVYPFESSRVVSSPQDKKTPPNDDARTSAQFPVVFLRHYSLFPFLTPFVVKGVKIEPDENQPLIITEPTNLNKSFKTHLTYPAVRQVVKITLSLVSAHYYLPIFGGKDEGDQIKEQTSGKTYLALAKSLLDKRIP